METETIPLVYTPSNEPSLGRELSGLRNARVPSQSSTPN